LPRLWARRGEVERSPRPASRICERSSVVERCPDKTEVEGPIPSARTSVPQIYYGARKTEVDCSDLSRTELCSGAGIPSARTSVPQIYYGARKTEVDCSDLSRTELCSGAGIPSARTSSCALSSVAERSVHIRKAVSSILTGRTAHKSDLCMQQDIVLVFFPNPYDRTDRG
jgi:hypothetical protein